MRSRTLLALLALLAAASSLARAQTVSVSCANEFGTAFAACGSDTSPGSQCCSGLSKVDQACLSTVVAVMSSAATGDQVALSALQAALTSCGIGVALSPPPASPASPASPPAPQPSPQPPPPPPPVFCAAEVSPIQAACSGTAAFELGSECCSRAEAVSSQCRAALLAALPSANLCVADGSGPAGSPGLLPPLAGGSPVTPSPSPTPAPSASPSPIPAPSPTAAPTPALSPAAAPAPSPTPSPSPVPAPGNGSQPSPPPAPPSACSSAVRIIAVIFCANISTLPPQSSDWLRCCNTVRFLFELPECAAELSAEGAVGSSFQGAGGNASAAAQGGGKPQGALMNAYQTCQIGTGFGATDTPSSSLSSGAIAGIAVGATVAVAAVAAAAAFLLRRRRRQQQLADAEQAGKDLDSQLQKPSGSGGGGGSLGAEWASLQSKLATVPTKPDGAAPSALGSAQSGAQKSSGGWASASDPLLSYMQFVQTQATSLATGATSATVGSSAGPRTPAGATHQAIASTASGGSDNFEIPFQELTLVKAIGSGSFGKVFLGSWHETPVACKVLIHSGLAAGATTPEQVEAALAESADLMAKLEEEVSLMLSLRHCNVVAYYGRCLTPPCIVTELCHRGSLCDVLAGARRDAGLAAALTWPRRLSMALDAALGMLYLHSRPTPLIHRDLKSPNLLVDSHWTVKVGDFNLARLLEDPSSQNSSAAVLNPRWLAPEVMDGERATQAADVFSFGVCLWELLTFELPWGPENPWQIAKQVARGGRPAIPEEGAVAGFAGGTVLPGYRQYVELLQRCWAQDAGQRPGFAEVAPRLRELLEAARSGVAGGGAGEEQQHVDPPA